MITPESAVWRKSTKSGTEQGDCVEVADLGPGLIGLRDSKDPTHSHLTIRAATFGRLVRQIKAQ